MKVRVRRTAASRAQLVVTRHSLPVPLLRLRPVPHKDFSDLYEKVSGEGGKCW